MLTYTVGWGLFVGGFSHLKSEPLANKHMLDFCIVHKYPEWEKSFDIACISVLMI